MVGDGLVVNAPLEDVLAFQVLAASGSVGAEPMVESKIIGAE